MSPFDRLNEEYGRHGISLQQYVRIHLKHGFVFSTPEVFAMGRAVERHAIPDLIRNPGYRFDDETADAWWIHGMSGDMSKVIAFMPWPLAWVGFERFDCIPRFYNLHRLAERTMKQELN